MRRALAVLVGAALLCAEPALAQQRDTLTLTGAAEDAPTPAARRYAHWTPTPSLVVGGMLGGAVGIAGGALIGSQLERRYGCENVDEWCGLLGGVAGAALGEALLLPLGVHLANGRQGSYLDSAVTSIGVGALGLALAFPTMGLILPVIPVAQLLTSIRAERRTAGGAGAPSPPSR